MRSTSLFCLLAAGLAPGFGSAAWGQTHGRHIFHPRTHCPELAMDGFCYYDSGWRPAGDNRLFSPLRRADPEAHSGPSCDARDSRGRTLLSYESENESVGPAMRIGGRLVRFRPLHDGGAVESFVSSEGRLTIREGAIVARDHESYATRTIVTFTDRRGRAHVASVRMDCGL